MIEMIERGATVSTCGLYRYRLLRRWSPGPTVCFVMLNPSTADAMTDDPTIRRCINFAHSWGFGELSVVNLYALRSTDPAALTTAADPIGPENAEHVERETRCAALRVAAWGAHPMARASVVTVNVFRPVSVLAVNRDGSPKHPLYVRGDLVPFQWTP